VRIWDTRPWTAEAAAEREAVGLLTCLFAKPLSQADVLDYLRNSGTIRPQARQKALALVDRYREETDPEKYHQASWALVRQPYLNADQYRFALCQAETACRLGRGQSRYQMTLGIAQYRNGRYAEALDLLTQVEQQHWATAAGLALLPTPYLPALIALPQADQLRQTVPANQAFLAMTQQQLGQGEKARKILTGLREVVRKSAGAMDREVADFLREAEGLVTGR
jgi:hypothetical protein